MKYRQFKDLQTRPDKEDRLFESGAVEQCIIDIGETIKDDDIRRMFSQCLPNSLDTTTYFHTDTHGNPNSYIVTGDIPAMWIRDSTNQIWPYRHFINQDSKIKDLFAGLIRQQTKFLSHDPYANAFFDHDISNRKTRSWKPNGDHWHKPVWERKYELDSLCSFFQLSTGYYEATKDEQYFDEHWLKVTKKLIEIIEEEQQTIDKDSLDNKFKFEDPRGKPFPSVRVLGYGYPGKECGLSRCVFRPSDDETFYPYIIASNAMAVVNLKKLRDLLMDLEHHELAHKALILSNHIDKGIQEHGTVNHEEFGKVYAYEVDGFGSHLIMDDPNVPSLLSLPYLGYVDQKDATYQRTRELLFSKWNPFYAEGKKATGLTSPHTKAFNYFWPMATIMQAMTTDDEQEIIRCLQTLKDTHGETYFMHEGVDVDDPTQFTREWFGWANSLFGELIIHLHENHEDVLKKDIR